MSVVNHIVNTNGKGANAFSETFHALRRTKDGLLYYTLRDKNVGTFSNDGGTTEIRSDEDFVTVREEYDTNQDESFSGNGTERDFTLSTKGYLADRLAVFVDRTRKIAELDYTVSGTTLTFTRAPHSGAEVFVRKIQKKYSGGVPDSFAYVQQGYVADDYVETSTTVTATYQQYKFENGRNHYRLNSDGKLQKVENRKMPVDEANFPTRVTDTDYENYDGENNVNSTTYSV